MIRNGSLIGLLPRRVPVVIGSALAGVSTQSFKQIYADTLEGGAVVLPRLSQRLGRIIDAEDYLRAHRSQDAKRSRAVLRARRKREEARRRATA